MSSASTPASDSPSPQRGAGGTAPVVRLNAQRRFGADLYHLMLSTSWPRLLLVIAISYVAVNTLFALGYLACGTGILNARRGSFTDAFFFSVQTMSTIGYGQMAPVTLGANVLVALEALGGLLGFTMATGLMFAKFSRATARVLFSRVAVVSLRDGVPSLMFRMANERSNQIVEAQLHVVLSRTETTAEGETVRRFFDLQLSRQQTALFTLTWTAIHPITSTSALFGESADTLRGKSTTITVSLLGFDETFSQTVHARHTYTVDQIVWSARLADILRDLPDGRRGVDYGRFHDTVPAPLAPAA